ncbi:hypothetical protein ALC60_11196 [Trachymyrmex zeteki]|uniref:MADF domain-containing protein n=1 Tax=Mycetomoellerius zeteki TaxID=64791 RepID=A0A151WPA6_9HYME|nr:hypothetical protein ALC60_11196 [Trachymyrmex zeteki]
MESLNPDEIIIEFVRENRCLYDKRDVNFKNIRKKKDLWQKISENLRNFEEIERRWSSLRDMFSRENRRQMLPPSGSGYEPRKEWELYRNMLFLVPHIAHRKTKTSFVQQSQSSLPQTSTADTSSPFTSKQSSNVITSSPFTSKQSSNVITSSPFTSKQSSNVITSSPFTSKQSSNVITSSPFTSKQSSNVITLLPDHSYSGSFQSIKDSSVFKSTKKVMPEMDEFAKRKKMKDNKLDHELEKASKEISMAVKAVSSQLDQKLEKDGYMSALEEGLKYVLLKHRTQCIIDLLQIIQKYEERQ